MKPLTFCLLLVSSFWINLLFLNDSQKVLFPKNKDQSMPMLLMWLLLDALVVYACFVLTVFLCSVLFPCPLLCLPFLISCAVICEFSQTRRPVCISLLAGITRGSLQICGMWGIVSRAAERMCPAWQKHRIYGPEVSLHLWTRDEKIPLSCSQKPSLPQVYPCTPISSLLDSSCISFQ